MMFFTGVLRRWRRRTRTPLIGSVTPAHAPRPCWSSDPGEVDQPTVLIFAQQPREAFPRAVTIPIRANDIRACEPATPSWLGLDRDALRVAPYTTDSMPPGRHSRTGPHALITLATGTRR